MVIPGRFNGPPGSGNGGFSAASLAAHLGTGPVTVTLRHPVPLDTPMDVEATEHGVSLGADGRLIAEAGRAEADELDAGEAVDVAAAGAAPPVFAEGEHPYPTCVVCGPSRADGLGIRVGWIRTGRLVACPWRPPAAFCDMDGWVRPEALWGALDCPGGLAAMSEGLSLLGRITVALSRPLHGAQETVVTGWKTSVDGRKIRAGGAVRTVEGEVVGVSAATWILLERGLGDDARG